MNKPERCFKSIAYTETVAQGNRSGVQRRTKPRPPRGATSISDFLYIACESLRLHFGASEAEWGVTRGDSENWSARATWRYYDGTYRQICTSFENGPPSTSIDQAQKRLLASLLCVEGCSL